jgi:hypothetical protein
VENCNFLANIFLKIITSVPDCANFRLHIGRLFWKLKITVIVRIFTDHYIVPRWSSTRSLCFHSRAWPWARPRASNTRARGAPSKKSAASPSWGANCEFVLFFLSVTMQWSLDRPWNEVHNVSLLCPGPNPTTMIYKFTIERFKNKNIFFYFERTLRGVF